MSKSRGRFGIHGGQYIPETLMNAVIELEQAYRKYKEDPDFVQEFNEMLATYVGRPSLLYYADRMTKDLGGAKIYLKREDLNHTGSHKLNNALGQALLAKRMGKKRLIAETGAGQHGVATATIAAFLGMECEVFMGKEDTERQALNVYRMELLGAKVHAVTSGTQTLKDAVNETLREWTNRIDDTHYVIGSVMGPAPFPEIVRDFQSVIGKEIKSQHYKKHAAEPFSRTFRHCFHGIIVICRSYLGFCFFAHFFSFVYLILLSVTLRSVFPYTLRPFPSPFFCLLWRLYHKSFLFCSFFRRCFRFPFFSEFYLFDLSQDLHSSHQRSRFIS